MAGELDELGLERELDAVLADYGRGARRADANADGRGDDGASGEWTATSRARD